MKKYFIAFCIITLFNILFVTIYMNSVAIPKIAVVNIQKIVGKASRVQELKAENNKQLDELEAWIEESRVKIQKEKDKTKREQLIDQYQDIARQKEDIIKQNYNKKLQEIDEEISEVIKTVAKNNKCDTILLNTAVMQGGKDITDEVLKNLPM